MKKRNSMICLLLAGLLLAACGGEAAPAGDTTAAPGTESAAPETTAAPAEPTGPELLYNGILTFYDSLEIKSVGKIRYTEGRGLPKTVHNIRITAE